MPPFRADKARKGGYFWTPESDWEQNVSDKSKTKAELLQEIVELRRREADFRTLQGEHGQALRALCERVKELDCLYAITRLAGREDISQDELFQRVTERVAMSWQYPEITCVRLVAGGDTYVTSNYKRARWRQTSPVVVHGEPAGELEVGYLEERPPQDEGPFLKEERSLIDAVADRLARIIEAKRTEEHVRVLSRELIKAQECERQRIARELHDNVAQELSMQRMGIEALLGEENAPADKLRHCLSLVSTRLTASIAAVRDLSYDLQPPGLEQLGFVPTVFRHCEDFSLRHGLRVVFFADGMDDLRLDFETQINLYRIIQEALANARRHAQATQVQVRLVASFPHILLRIEDNGCGFDAEARLTEALREKRMGLWSMQERARLLGGRMTIRSRPGSGTKLVAEIPCREKP